MAKRKLRGVSLYDRPAIALANLLKGHPDAVVRALLSPKSLTPEEQERISDKILKNADDHPYLKVLIDITTNPVFLMGLAAVAYYPTVSAKEMFRLAPKFSAYNSALNPLLKFIGGPRTIFAGTKIPDILDDVMMAIDSFKKRYIMGGPDHPGMAGVFKTFKARTGRIMNLQEQIVLAAKLDGLDRPDSWLAKSFKLSKPLVNNLDDLMPKGSALEEAYHRVRGVLNSIKDELMALPPDSKKRIMLNIEKRGFAVGGTFNWKTDKEMTESFVKWIDNYLPHIVAEDSETLFRSIQSVSRSMAGVSDASRAKRMEAMIHNLVSSNLLPRRGWMLPLERHIEELAKLGKINPDAQRELYGKLALKADWFRDQLTQAVMRVDPANPESSKAFITQVSSILAGGDQHLRHYSGPLKGLMMFPGLGLPEDMASGRAFHALNILRSGGGREEAARLLTMHVTETAGTVPYSLHLEEVMNRYISRLAPTVVLTGQKKAAELAREASMLYGAVVRQGDALLPVGKPRVEILYKDYLPMILGYPPTDRTVSRMFWRSSLLKTYDWLRGAVATKYIPPKVRNWMLTEAEKGFLGSDYSVGRSLAGYLYLSTLGFNPSPALKNLLQPLITTAGLFSPEHYLAGNARMLKGAEQYMRLRAGGMGDFEAMNAAFPEFVNSGLIMDPIAEEAIRGGIHKAMAASGTAEKLRQLMMAFFTASERGNRILSFYTATAAGADAGMTGKELLQFGRQVVQSTQFPGGPLGVPYGLRNWPPILRQFMHFPLKYLEFLTGSTTWGSGAPGPMYGRRQFRTIGKVAMASTAVYTAAKEMAGVDLSGGLLTGALPLPTYEEAPFYPWPLVPPAAALVGTGVKALATGETRQLGAAGAMLVPGGLAVRRAYRTLAPKFAGYDRATPEGRIPVYSDEGMLIGYRTPWELTAKAIGFQPSSMQEEQEFTAWLLKQRDQIREYRRLYLEAIMNNEWDRAQEINQEFKKRYPQLGDIQVKRSDLQALERRKTQTRISRILAGFPREYRPMFEQAAATTLGASILEPSSFIEGQHYLNIQRGTGYRVPMGLMNQPSPLNQGIPPSPFLAPNLPGF